MQFINVLDLDASSMETMSTKLYTVFYWSFLIWIIFSVERKHLAMIALLIRFSLSCSSSRHCEKVFSGISTRPIFAETLTRIGITCESCCVKFNDFLLSSFIVVNLRSYESCRSLVQATIGLWPMIPIFDKRIKHEIIVHSILSTSLELSHKMFGLTNFECTFNSISLYSSIPSTFNSRNDLLIWSPINKFHRLYSRAFTTKIIGVDIFTSSDNASIVTVLIPQGKYKVSTESFTHATDVARLLLYSRVSSTIPNGFEKRGPNGFMNNDCIFQHPAILTNLTPFPSIKSISKKVKMN